MAPSGTTKKASPQGGVIHVSSIPGVPRPLSEEHGIFSNKDLLSPIVGNQGQQQKTVHFGSLLESPR